MWPRPSVQGGHVTLISPSRVIPRAFPGTMGKGVLLFHWKCLAESCRGLRLELLELHEKRLSENEPNSGKQSWGRESNSFLMSPGSSHTWNPPHSKIWEPVYLPLPPFFSLPTPEPVWGYISVTPTTYLFLGKKSSGFHRKIKRKKNSKNYLKRSSSLVPCIWVYECSKFFLISYS